MTDKERKERIKELRNSMKIRKALDTAKTVAGIRGEIRRGKR